MCPTVKCATRLCAHNMLCPAQTEHCALIIDGTAVPFQRRTLSSPHLPPPPPPPPPLLPLIPPASARSTTPPRLNFIMFAPQDCA